MAQTRAGAKKIAAKKAGCTVEQYEDRLRRGQKWCSGCKSWHDQSAFTTDRSRWDGLKPQCLAWSRSKYVRKPATLKRGRTFVPARDGDARQARRRINYFVECGLLPHPNTLACSDCGHLYALGGRRHEYDHHLGYDAEHHEHVEAVCSRCHCLRETSRKIGS